MWHVHCQVIPLTRAAATRASIWKKCQSIRPDMACWRWCFDGDCFSVTPSDREGNTTTEKNLECQCDRLSSHCHSVTCVMPNDFAWQDYKPESSWNMNSFMSSRTVWTQWQFNLVESGSLSVGFDGTEDCDWKLMIWLDNFWNTHFGIHKCVQTFTIVSKWSPVCRNLALCP